MGRENKMIGAMGEDAACRFLEKNGYEILERNFRTVFGEIDIIARRRGITVFVEVKTRASSSLGPPFISITKIKQLHMIRNALAYLKIRGRVYSDWRIDVASVIFDSMHNLKSVEMIENAVTEDN
ncbi:MAG: YraN family protein [Candidatus Omnitrophica bacterium]|nr:YraN family protein [Candidatus Omnitrophota bacterium]